MTAAAGAPTDYVAGKTITVPLVDLDTGEPLLDAGGKERYEERLPGDPVPEARFWEGWWKERRLGRLLTRDELDRGVLVPPPHVVRGELDEQARLQAVAERDDGEPLLSDVHVEAEATPPLQPEPRPRAKSRPRSRAQLGRG